MIDIEKESLFKEKRPLYQLLELAAILRGENGCLWDKEQTSQTLKPYLIEETYEVLEAIDSANADNLKEELGDLLYQVYAHAQIASDENLFNIDDIADGIIKKLVHRHPHVFGSEDGADKNKIISRWEILKRKEKKKNESILSGVPKELPALLKAYRVQQKASRVGFDWDKIEDVKPKLDEEVAEFKSALENYDIEEITEEIGDLLFTIVNISRFLKINPEEALSKTIIKFMKRFQFVEKEVNKKGKNIADTNLNELDEIWERAKEKL